MTATQPDTMFAPAERADRILLDQQAAYFQGNILLASLLDSVPNAFVVRNQQRQIVYTNRALVRWAGVEAPETLMGLRPGEALNCLHAHQDTGGCGTTEFCRTCGAVQAILTSLAGKETVQECRITRTDGTSVDLRASATPFNWKNDVFSLFAIQDISHEKRRQALEHIFFHDILNTAGALIGFADLLRDDRATQLHEIDLKGMVFDLSQQVVDQIQGQRELADAERGDLVPTWIRLDPVDVFYGRRGPAHRCRPGKLCPTAR